MIIQITKSEVQLSQLDEVSNLVEESFLVTNVSLKSLDDGAQVCFSGPSSSIPLTTIRFDVDECQEAYRAAVHMMNEDGVYEINEIGDALRARMPQNAKLFD